MRPGKKSSHEARQKGKAWGKARLRTRQCNIIHKIIIIIQYNNIKRQGRVNTRQDKMRQH
jgi:hypothetical protein